ncbi:MAG TPA: M20 family peptidase, partial [Alphaproteobacteria bacterium]|nr:M20 family peptidase [Alphaproteobacteria bacterium]
MNSINSKSDIEASLVSILTDLIGLQSDYPPGDTVEICKYTEQRLKNLGYRIKNHMHVTPINNLIAEMGHSSPSVVFNVHVDTVGPGLLSAWSGNPYCAEIKDERVYGLGAANCKGSMAVHIWLAEEISRRGGIRRGTISFTFVGDEESLGPNGTKSLRDRSIIRPDILIVGAPSSNDLLIDERGVMWLRLTTCGTGGHAGDPASADNAIDRLVRLLRFLEAEIFCKLKDRKQGEILSTANVGKIRGGTNTNVVPVEAVAEIDRRLLPGESVDQALDEIQAALRKSGEPEDSYELELLVGTNGFKGRSDGQGVTAFSEAIRQRLKREPCFLTPVGAFDGRHFVGDDIEIINVG